MLKIILLVLALHIPQKSNVVYVDMIEINTVCDDYSFPIFTQYIFWEWKGIDWCVVDWKRNEKIWVKSDEHFVKWDKALREFCDNYKLLDYIQAKNKYNGEYLPIPGVNFPEKRLDYWRVVVDSAGKEVEVKAKIFRETWTKTDPERKNREKFSESQRRGLKVKDNEEQADEYIYP